MQTKKVCRVAAIQMISTDSVRQNLEKIKESVGRCAEKGARLVLLPEYFSFMGNFEKEKLSVAETDFLTSEKSEKSEVQEFLSSVAKENAIWIIGGTVPIKSKNKNKVFNSMIVFDDQGIRKARYDKIHLFEFSNGEEQHNETRYCIAGESPRSLETPAGNTLLSVCYDLRFPELYRRKSTRDDTTDLIVVSAAFTKETGLAHWEILLRARAIENQAYVLASAQGGRHPSGRETWGHSMFISPWGDIIKDCGFGDDQVFGTVDFDYLGFVRKKLPSLDHQKFNLKKRSVC